MKIMINHLGSSVAVFPFEDNQNLPQKKKKKKEREKEVN